MKSILNRIAQRFHKEEGLSCPVLVRTGVSALLITLAFAQEPDDRVILVPLAKAPKEAPLFFSATADVKIQVGMEEVTSEQEIDFKFRTPDLGRVMGVLTMIPI